jgi:hypothetical protein
VKKRNEGGNAFSCGTPSPPRHSSSPAKAGDPVRRGFSVQSSLSLGYWIARPSAQLRTRRAMTVGVVIASEAKQSIVRHKERMDCFASLAMTDVIDAPSTATVADMISRSRDMNCPRFAPSFALLEYRGRREDRVRAAPAISCAIAHKERAHEHTGPAESIRPSLRNGFTAYFVLSPVCEFL